MSFKKINLKNAQFFHATIHSQREVWNANIDLGKIWEKTLHHLFSFESLGLKPHAFVLMKNHFHLLACIQTIAQIEITSEIFNSLKQAVEKEFHNRQLSFNLQKIEHQKQYFETYRYILNNPNYAGIKNHGYNYPYSSLSILNGMVKYPGIIHDPLGSIFNPERIHRWLKEAINESNFETSRFDMSN